jgi:hypothetical protein
LEGPNFAAPENPSQEAPVKMILSILGLISPLILGAAEVPPENRTNCQDLLVMHGPFGTIKEGYEEISFQAKGVTVATGAGPAIHVNRALLGRMTEVLEQNGLSGEVLFFVRDFHSRVNPLALELLAKGVSPETVGNFHPNWQRSEPSRTIIWDVRDPLYLILKYEIRQDFDGFDIWVKSTAKKRIIKLWKEAIPEGVFYDGLFGWKAFGHVT